MSRSITNAWAWSLKRSPLIALWRSFRSIIRPNREAFTLLDAAGLPVQVDRVIRVTIARTKLWRDERAQIARELIAHAQDAIEAGRDPDQVMQSFGDPRRVARLFRRSMKRKRPLVWQAYRYSRRAFGVAALVLLFGYGWLAVRFYASGPSIKVNYAAQLDARNQGYSEDQKSWPAIAEVGLEWSRVTHALQVNQTAEFHGVPYDEYSAGRGRFCLRSRSIILTMTRWQRRRDRLSRISCDSVSWRTGLSSASQSGISSLRPSGRVVPTPPGLCPHPMMISLNAR
jgi:hypothetical protein